MPKFSKILHYGVNKIAQNGDFIGQISHRPTKKEAEEAKQQYEINNAKTLASHGWKVEVKAVRE
jgi:hypothetical protein